jgi:hypothetical protein
MRHPAIRGAYVTDPEVVVPGSEIVMHIPMPRSVR